MKLIALALALVLTGMAAAPDIMGNAFGNPNAPITMEIFSDFQCSACKSLHDNALPELMREFVVPGKVYLIQRYFPRCVRAPDPDRRQGHVLVKAELFTWPLHEMRENGCDRCA